MRILALGPYIGSWQEEIFSFRPYIRWVIEAVKYDKVYLCTHLNRFFLYDHFIFPENIIPIYQHFSRDEKNQIGYVHNKLGKKDFNLVVKKFKDEIVKREGCNRRDIEIYNLSYSKNTPPISVYNKIYEPIKTDIKIIKKNIIYIPCKTDRRDRVFDVYNFLKSYYNDVVVIGDMNTWISQENVILDRLDYFENGWKYIIEYINKSMAVICPLSYWTGISNLQNKPIFSWGVQGQNISQYKENGILNFNNKNCWAYPISSKTTDIEVITNGIKRFLYEISGLC
jgi:hypothetical protein